MVLLVVRSCVNGLCSGEIYSSQFRRGGEQPKPNIRGCLLSFLPNLRRFCGRICLADWSGLIQSFVCVTAQNWNDLTPLAVIYQRSAFCSYGRQIRQGCCVWVENSCEFMHGSSTGSVEPWTNPVSVACGDPDGVSRGLAPSLASVSPGFGM